jgi:SAM-dependent methyltransferase
MSEQTIKETVRERYGAVAERNESCCGSGTGCGTDASLSQKIGYSEEEMSSVPDGANLGLGCGNPLAMSSIQEGETVLDLGSGAGFDCFLAAKRVGGSGRVIGVDMTPQMLAKARANAEKGGYTNVEFREGEIEQLPVADNEVDVVISNCVINLSPDKDAVFGEIYRVLKPGGRFYISDIVLEKPLPESVLSSAGAYTACVAGALLKEDYLARIEKAGLSGAQITHEAKYPLDGLTNDPEASSFAKAAKEVSAEDRRAAADAIVSAKVEGRKPLAAMSTGASCCGGSC